MSGSGSGISWAICKSAPRSRQITMPAPQHSVFTGRMPFLSPSQQRQSTEGHKFTTHSCLNIPPCLKHVTTLPCDVWTSEKRSQSEICIVIHDKSQGCIAKQLTNDELLYYTFITQSAGERIFKIGKQLEKLQAKWWLFHAPHLHCTFVLKDSDLAR